MKIMGSKKASAFLTALIIIVCVHLLGMDETTATNISDAVLKLTGTYMIGQGVADIGKGKAEAENKDAE